MSTLSALAQKKIAPLVNNIGPDIGGLQLTAKSTLKRLKAGETLYLEGDTAPYCYQVISGIVKEFNTLSDGRRQVIEFYNADDIFGISELHSQLHTAEGVTDCLLRCFDRNALVHEIASSPQLSQRFLDMLMLRLHRVRERLVMLGRMSSVQRVAAFLVRLSKEQATTQHIIVMVSRQEIADHLGLTIETVCRAITELKKRGLISMASKRDFSIPEINLLDDIAHGEHGVH
ncbi:MAG: helix-turn-helix domain-containing protein [Pseudomonadota bacterium]